MQYRHSCVFKFWTTLIIYIYWAGIDDGKKAHHQVHMNPFNLYYWTLIDTRNCIYKHVLLDLSPRNWRHEPNDYAFNEDCGQMYGDGVLNDMDCQAHLGYICEYPRTSGKAVVHLYHSVTHGNNQKF